MMILKCISGEYFAVSPFSDLPLTEIMTMCVHLAEKTNDYNISITSDKHKVLKIYCTIIQLWWSIKWYEWILYDDGYTKIEYARSLVSNTVWKVDTVHGKSEWSKFGLLGIIKLRIAL